jgi:hypothetical protein
LSRYPDSHQFDLAEAFRRVQTQTQAHLAVDRMFEHASSSGTAAEHRWLEIFARYLPQCYQAGPAFIINADGRRSRQIDIAIFDTLEYSPLFPHPVGLHLPVESVYAVFEIKPTVSVQWMEDAAEKAASVRGLLEVEGGARRRQHILAGLLASSSVWTPGSYAGNLTRTLQTLKGDRHLDLGISLEHGAFEARWPGRGRRAAVPRVSEPDEALIFFILHLLEGLRELRGKAKPADLRAYHRVLASETLGRK